LAAAESGTGSHRGTGPDLSQKFGQVLAMRSDLLPAIYIDELRLLHDHLPAMGIDAARATVEVELGAPLTELFSSFRETPLANS
jgi:ubiquinone biosynthesis protein